MTWRRGLIVAVILLVPVAIHGIWDQWEATLFAREVRRIADRHEPTDLSELNRALESVEQRRSASLYAAAARLSTNLTAPEAGLLFYRVDLSLAALPDKLVEQAAEVLARAEPALTLLALATPLDFSRFGDVTSELNEIQWPLETLNQQTCLKADVLSSRGQGDEAVEYLIQAARLQRTMSIATYRDRAKSRFYGSVRILLGRGRASAASLTALQNAVQEWPDEDDAATQLINTRARLLDEVWRHPTANGAWVYRIRSTARPAEQGLVEQMWFLSTRPFLTHLMRVNIVDFERAIDIARLPLLDRFSAAREFMGPESGLPPPDHPTLFERVFGFPASSFAAAILVNDIRVGARGLAYRRTAVTALAIERYRAAYGGRAPDDLSVLVPEYLPAVPRDPFSTDQLKYRRNQDGYVIYSVGVNQIDDGGELYGFGSGKDPHSPRLSPQAPVDIGIRVVTATNR